MNTQDSAPVDESASEDVQVLRRGLQAASLSADAIARIRAAAEQEWQIQTQSADGISSRSRWWATAATLLIASALLGWYIQVSRGPAVATTTFGALAKAQVPGLIEQRGLASKNVIPVGGELRVGQSLRAQGAALVALQGGGSLRLAAATSIEVVSEQRLRLTQGLVYLDFPLDVTRTKQFVVETLTGDFSHVGTQFEVAVHGDRAQVRVREGRVQWRGSNGSTALADAGTEMLVGSDGTVTQKPTATSGAAWTWVESLAPEFDMDGRTLAEYLLWVSRESGRKLVFADAAAQQRARATQLHGTFRGLPLLVTLSAVMATTTLQADVTDKLIRVNSAGATKSARPAN